MEINELSGIVVDAAFKVHTTLGPGLLENVYEACLAHELRRRGLTVITQAYLPICYEGLVLETGYRMDLLVEDTVIVELKSVESIEPIHEAQLLTYLKLSGKRLGLLINFNVIRIRDGIRRLSNHAPSLSDWDPSQSKQDPSSAPSPRSPRPPR